MNKRHCLINLLVIVLLIFTSCQSKNNKSATSNQSIDFKDSISQIQIDTSQAVAIVKELTYKNPKYLSIKYIDKKPIIICVFLDNEKGWGNSYINVFENFANHWQGSKRLTIEDGLKIENFDWIKIQNKDMLYFDFNVAGGTMGNYWVVFGLYDYIINKYYKLEYSGLNEYGSFTNIDSLKNTPEILNALEFKASKSDKIHRPSKDELDINNPKNATKRFILDNPSLREDVKTYRREYQNIKITKYQDESATFFRENIGNKNGGYINSLSCEISNNDFHVYSIFKSYVICLDKNRNYYFIVWMPFTMYDWVVKMDLSEDNFLTLYNRFDNEQEFIIDLNNMKIKCISSKEYR